MISLMKSSFYQEQETKQKLIEFIRKAKILSMSEECKKYEQAFAQKQERKFSIFVSSGSMANLILIQSLLNLGKLKKGDKVGVSALTWVTNITPIIQLGLTPVAIDCELDTLNVSPKTLAKKINNIQALFLTNVLGFSDAINEIETVCHEKGILFLEDNCEALGSKVKGKLLGNFSSASTFSFFVGHHLSTIEGGMVCTDDPEIHQMLVMTRAHGWDRNLNNQKQIELRTKHAVNPFFAKYTFYDLAYNGRPTEISGFLGNNQIRFWEEIVSKRANAFHKFQKTIRENPDLINLRTDHMDIVSNFAVPVIAKNKHLFQNYRLKFENNGVEIRPIIAGDLTRQPFYKKYVSHPEECPNTAFIHENGFYFGNNPELTDQEIQTLNQLLKK